MKKIIFFLTVLVFSGTAFSASTDAWLSSEYRASTRIYYTICNDVMENNPSCSEERTLSIGPHMTMVFGLDAETDRVYIWKAVQEERGNALKIDFTRKIESKGNSINSSDCVIQPGKILVIDRASSADLITCAIKVSGTRYWT